MRSAVAGRIAICVTTPVMEPYSDFGAEATATVARVREAWEACGAKVSNLPPERHDRVL